MGKAFAEVLDDCLNGHEPRPAAAHGPASRIATTSLFFGMADLTMSALPMRAPAPAPVRFHAAPPPRPKRTLSGPEQQALQVIAGLGGQLPDDFTDDDLKHVYRRLALRYHPDRHPGCSEADRARLSSCFIQLSDAYDRLCAVPTTIN
jgi:hypothetical protein